MQVDLFTGPSVKRAELNAGVPAIIPKAESESAKFHQSEQSLCTNSRFTRTGNPKRP
jgi:hypothetical protein